MTDFKNDLHVWVPHEFPDQIIEMFNNELSTPELKLEISKSPPRGVYNMVEWALPTLIGVYIFKTYFDTFLKEAAKDHYKLLKDWIKKTSKETRLIKVTTITASQSSEKVSKSNTQSKVFSVKSKTNTGLTITFLFDDSLDNELWDKAIDNLLSILENHFSNGETDRLTVEIEQKKFEKTIYAKMKSDNGDWEFLAIHHLQS